MWVTRINHQLDMQGLIYPHVRLPSVSRCNEICDRLNVKLETSDSPIGQWWIPFDRPASVHANLRRKTTDGHRARGGIAQLPPARQFRSGRHAEVDGTWRAYLCKLAQKRQSTIATTAAVDVRRRFARRGPPSLRATAKLRCTHRVLV